MSISRRHIGILAAAIVLVLVIPASAAHGGGSGSSSSAGGYGQAGTADAGGGGWSGSPGGGPGYGSGEPAAQAQAGVGSPGPSAAPGSLTAQQGATQTRAGQESSRPSSTPGYTVHAGYRGISSAAGSQAMTVQGLQGGTWAGARYGPVSSTAGDGAIPPARHRGPPAQAQPFGPGTQAGRYPCGPAQAADPLAGVAGTPEQGSKGQASPRVKRDDDELPAPTGEPAADPFISPALFLPFLGYRRVSAKNVLSHDARGRVYGAIAAHPGIDTLALAEMVEVNKNTLRYHLFTLLRAGKITAFSRPGVVRYYLNQGMYPPFCQCLLHYMWTETPREIISLLWHEPGMTRAQVADALSLSGPSITRHIRNLSDDGIIETLVSGRSHHYSLTPATLIALESCRGGAPAPAVHRMDAAALPTPA